MADELTVLRCWACAASGRDDDRYCTKCTGTGRLFWVNGVAFPYSPQGEKAARKFEQTKG